MSNAISDTQSVTTTQSTTVAQKSYQYCEAHVKQRVVFFCNECTHNICQLCVPLHSRHDLKLIKNEVTALLKPWKSLHSQLN